MDGVVDVWQVVQGWSLSDSSELVIDGSVAEAHPTLVGTEIWHWDATQVSANSRAHEHAGVSCIRQGSWRALIKLGGGWQGPGLLGLGHSETSDEDHLTVPGGLENLTRRQLRDVELLVRVSDVSGSGDHLVVDDGEDGLDAEAVEGEDEALEHVDLGSLDLIVSVLFIPQSVLVEPVVWLGLGVQGVPEVRWPRRGHPVHWSVCAKHVVDELLALSVSVVLQNTKVSGGNSGGSVSLGPSDELARGK